jgi:hypothetical protein
MCRFVVPYILNKPQLPDVDLKIFLRNEPSSCVGDSAWAQAGLPVLPPEVVSQGWEALLQHIREVRCCGLCLRLVCRIMTIRARRVCGFS